MTFVLTSVIFCFTCSLFAFGSCFKNWILISLNFGLFDVRSHGWSGDNKAGRRFQLSVHLQCPNIFVDIFDIDIHQWMSEIAIGCSIRISSIDNFHFSSSMSILFADMANIASHIIQHEENWSQDLMGIDVLSRFDFGFDSFNILLAQDC